MIGDKLNITDYHRSAAASIFGVLKIKMLDADTPFIVTIAGESGIAKDECLRLCDIKSCPFLGQLFTDTLKIFRVSVSLRANSNERRPEPRQLR